MARVRVHLQIRGWRACSPRHSNGANFVRTHSVNSLSSTSLRFFASNLRCPGLPLLFRLGQRVCHSPFDCARLRDLSAGEGAEQTATGDR
eukprot:COSAG04_NODE_24585_length_319_cov_1.381818_1_plen_89_part_10